MYALVKIRKEQLLTRSIQLPIVFIDEEIGIVNSDVDLRDKLKYYPEIDYMEDIFSIKLKGKKNEKIIETPKGSILIYIGKGIENQEGWHIYDCNKGRIEKVINEVARYKVATENNHINSLQYLECIIDMIYEAKKNNKRLIVYTEIEINDMDYKYRSLMDKVVNRLLAAVEGIYIHQCNGIIKDYYTATNQRFEPYINQAIYTTDTLEQTMEKMRFLIKDNISSVMIRKEYRELSKRQSILY